MTRLTLLLLLIALSSGCSGATAESAGTSIVRAQSATRPTSLNARSASGPASAQKSGAGSRASQLLSRFRDATDPQILVVAHRGDWHSAPENSLAAIESCIEMGVDMVEIDVRTTSDGQFVLMHDKTLERTTTGSGKVSSLTLAELQQLYLKDQTGNATKHHPPSLEEALNLTRGRILVYLDKTDHIIPAMYQFVDRLKLGDEVFFYGHRPLHELATECGDVLEQINYLPKIGDETPHLATYVEQFQKQQKPAAFVISFDNPKSPVLGICTSIRQGKTRIWASPLSPEMAAGRTDDAALTDPDGNWGWLMDHGATIFCTDRPRELLAYLRRRGRHD